VNQLEQENRMKFSTLIKWILAAVTVWAASASASRFASFGSSGEEQRTCLVVKGDGSCLLTNVSLLPRKWLESQLASWVRYRNRSEDADDSDPDDAPASAPKSPAKQFTDEELAAKLREMYDQMSEMDESGSTTIKTLDVTTNLVRVVSTASFASLTELLGDNLWNWGPGVLMFANARVEIDSGNHLVITFAPPKGGERYTRNTAREWKSGKIKFEWKLILPGKILSSGLPHTEANYTWLSLDSEKPETIEAGLKLVGAPLVITAESGRIRLNEPLDAEKLMRAARKRAPAGFDQPVTEAGPGFVAEPVGIRVSTVYLFPEGEKFFKDRPMTRYGGDESPGTVVSARLFPPKGRSIKSVTELKVKKARDDQGRSIGGADSEYSGQEISPDYDFESNDSSKSEAANVELRLGLPAPDAKTIEEIEAEAVALTIGGWKEMTLTNLQADPKKEIDLGEVLPGAKIIIRKLSSQGPQTRVDARLEGPPAIGALEVKVKLGGANSGPSSMNGQRPVTAGGKTTRNITLHAYAFEPGGAGPGNRPLTLLVRRPQDVKRERVQFKLTALDLF